MDSPLKTAGMAINMHTVILGYLQSDTKRVHVRQSEIVEGLVSWRFIKGGSSKDCEVRSVSYPDNPFLKDADVNRHA